MLTEGEQAPTPKQRVIYTWRTILSSSPENPIRPLRYKDLTYNHPTRILYIDDRDPVILGPSSAVSFFHLLLNKGQLITPWELVVVRGLASTDRDGASARTEVSRLRRNLYDSSSPYEYIQTIRGRRLTGYDSYSRYTIPKV